MSDAYEKISGADFDIADPENGVIPFSMSLEGLDGTGKTYLPLMTGPLPVVHLNFSDRDATPFLYEMSDARRKQTTLYNIRSNSIKGWTRTEGITSLQKLSAVIVEELGGGKLKGGTLVLDGGSSWWEVMQECYVAPEVERHQREFGKQLGGLAYGPANLLVKGFLNWVKNQGAFIILTHQLTSEWDKDGPIPGAYRARQNGQIPYMVEARLRLSKTCNNCGAPECFSTNHVGRTHWATIMKFGTKSDLVGTIVPNPTMSTIYALYAGKLLKGVPEDATT